MKQILLAGGNGKRIFHILKQPKQFCRIIHHKGNQYSTLMLAIERAIEISKNEIILSINKNYIETAIEQLNLVTQNTDRFFIIAENDTSNTMLAIYSAISFIKNHLEQKNEKILISPCDHIINQVDKYKNDVNISDISDKKINLLGIKPTNIIDSVKYGNIFCNPDNNEINVFLEKPTIETIQLINKNLIHYWNSGIFLLDTDYILKKIENFLEKNTIYIDYQKKKIENLNFPLEKIFFLNRIENIGLLTMPFDLLISENLSHSSVLQASFDWLDIGSVEVIEGIVSANSIKGL
jgi:mannose-1-phosphate guanylyltransferase